MRPNNSFTASGSTPKHTELNQNTPSAVLPMKPVRSVTDEAVRSAYTPCLQQVQMS